MAFIELELANVSLEDVILSELNITPNPNGTAEIIKHLIASKKMLEASTTCLHKLKAQMDDGDFNDLPSLKVTDLCALGKSLVSKGIVDETSWKVVAEQMDTSGFYGIIRHFDASIADLIELTAQLTNAIDILSDTAASGNLSLTLEENKEGNFKVEFAKLYQKWASFQQLFLASSICSTELWYRFNRFGSLISDTDASFKAA